MYNAYEITNKLIRSLPAQGPNMLHPLMRQIDNKFATTRDGHIIKMSNGEILPPEEPLFLTRARDRLAVQHLIDYKRLSEADGCNDWHFESLDAWIAEFKAFKNSFPERMKQPSITKGK